MKIAFGLVLLFLLASPIVAFSQDDVVADFALMGLRLNMTPEQATQVLRGESDNVRDQAASCGIAPTEGCRKILALLPDGSIEVLFRPSPGGFRSVRIALTVKARGESDRDAIISAAIQYYGPPTLEEPAWCTLDSLGGACRDDAPAMVFRPLAGAAGEFILREASNGDP